MSKLSIVKHCQKNVKHCQKIVKNCQNLSKSVKKLSIDESYRVIKFREVKTVKEVMACDVSPMEMFCFQSSQPIS